MVTGIVGYEFITGIMLLSNELPASGDPFPQLLLDFPHRKTRVTGSPVWLEEVYVEVDSIAMVEPDPFPIQQGFLDLVTAGRLEGYSTPGVDDAVPGQVVPSGAGMKDPGYLPRAPRVARERGDLAIGGDFADRDSLDDRSYSLGE